MLMFTDKNMKQIIEQMEYLCNIASNPANGYAQITIDFFDEFDDQFLNERDEPIERDEVWAKNYEIGNILEVIDEKKFAKDVNIFKKMSVLIDSLAQYIESRNISNGTPRHR